MHALEAVVDQPLAEVEAALRQALSEEGFGILTEIDLAATLEAKLGVHRPPMKILGACNPSLAHRALGLDPSLALVLPCNVVLEDAGEAGTHVAIADPRALLNAGGIGDDRLEALGTEASTAFGRALARLGR
jgi:uncharacterized protein (DUF302 family)